MTISCTPCVPLSKSLLLTTLLCQGGGRTGAGGAWLRGGAGQRGLGQPCSYLRAIGELVLQPVQKCKIGPGEWPGGWGGPGQAELLTLLLHSQLLGWIWPHCGQRRAQRGLSTGHHCPAWGQSPPKRLRHPDPTLKVSPAPRCCWVELTNVTDEEAGGGEVEEGGVRDPLQVQLQLVQLLREGAEGGVREAGVELATTTGHRYPVPEGSVTAKQGGRERWAPTGLGPGSRVPTCASAGHGKRPSGALSRSSGRSRGRSQPGRRRSWPPPHLVGPGDNG